MSLPEEIVSLVKTKFSIIASLDGQLLMTPLWHSFLPQDVPRLARKQRSINTLAQGVLCYDDPRSHAAVG